MHIQSNIIYNSLNWELEHEWTVNKNVELKNPNSVISEPEKEIDDYDDELLLDENVKGHIINKVQEETIGVERHELDMYINLLIDDGRIIDAHALIDLGCTGSFIDAGFVERYKIPTKKLPEPADVLNADGSKNEGGKMTHYVELTLQVENHEERIRLPILTLKSANVFLGYSWLKHHNPLIDWLTGDVLFDRCPDSCDHSVATAKETLPRARRLDINLNTWQGKEWKKVTPERYQTPQCRTHPWPSYLDPYADVFSEESFEKLPEHRIWDHVIELKPDFKPTDCKVYPLNLKEQEELKRFIDENLKSGRIRRSTSPMASPFFFIKKTDGTLRAI